jgi:hypothetical protein
MRSAVLCCLSCLSVTVLGRAADPLPSGFYVVSRTAGPGLQYVDSPALPKLGYVAATPDLPISTLISATLETCHERSTMVHKDGSSESSEEDRPCIQIELTAADAKRLETVTREHLDSRLLLVIAGEAVSAPTIRSPIDTPSIRFTLGEHADPSDIKKKIDALISKAKTLPSAGANGHPLCAHLSRR